MKFQALDQIGWGKTRKWTSKDELKLSLNQHITKTQLSKHKQWPLKVTLS
jgi:hypothetical protein